MIPEKDFTNADTGERVISLNDPLTGFSFIIAATAGVMRVKVYFEALHVSDYELSPDGASKLAKALQSASGFIR